MTALPRWIALLHHGHRLLDLVEHGLDVGLRIGRLPESRLVARLIHNIPWITCAATSYLKERKAPVHPKDLLNHHCLSHANLMPDRLWHYRDQKGTEIAVKLEGGHVTNSVAVLKELTLAGLGIALVPQFAIARELRYKGLVPLLTTYAAPPLPLHVLYPPNRYLAAKVRVFIDFLATRFSRGKWY